MDIPFFPNTGDGTHCFQAALRMALGALMPDRSFSIAELDRLSQKLPGKWTWPTAAMLWMIEQGLKVQLIEEFDYRAFVEQGETYLLDRFGEEVGRAQIANSDIERERGIASRFIAVAPLEYRIPDLDDVRRLLAQGAVIIVNINAAALFERPGYSGHFVVICDVGDEVVTLHDPGLPPAPNVRVSHSAFECAWAYPATRDKNLMAMSR